MEVCDSGYWLQGSIDEIMMTTASSYGYLKEDEINTSKDLKLTNSLLNNMDEGNGTTS